MVDSTDLGMDLAVCSSSSVATCCNFAFFASDLSFECLGRMSLKEGGFLW